MSDEVVLMKVFETDTKPTADEAQAGIMRIHLDRMRIATKSFYRRRLGA